MITRRASRLAVAGLLLPLALTACGDEADQPGALGAPSAAASTPAAGAVPTDAPPTAAPTPPAATPPAPTPAADDARVLTLTVAGGKVTGDTGRAPVELGEKVRMTVTSDVADEIHVHGYDLYVDAAPGQPAQVEFVADQPGVFEVEFHDSGLLLTRLQVQ